MAGGCRSKWFKFNDERVTVSSSEEAVQQNFGCEAEDDALSSALQSNMRNRSLPSYAPPKPASRSEARAVTGAVTWGSAGVSGRCGGVAQPQCVGTTSLCCAHDHTRAT
jgi:hypothetical protein